MPERKEHEELYYWFFPGAHTKKSKWEELKLRQHLKNVKEQVQDQGTKLVMNTEWSPGWVERELGEENFIQEEELTKEEVNEKTKIKAMGEYLRYCCAGGTADLVNKYGLSAREVRFKVDPSFSIQIDKVPDMDREELEDKIKEIRLETVNEYLTNLNDKKKREITGEEPDKIKEMVQENRKRVEEGEGVTERLQEMTENYPDLMQTLPDEEFDTLREIHYMSQKARLEDNEEA